MTVPVHGRARRWIVDPIVGDTTDIARRGFWGRLRAEWKFFAAVAVTALLTWREWVDHHPPEIALAALIHFVFAWLAVAIAVHTARWFSRGNRKSR